MSSRDLEFLYNMVKVAYSHPEIKEAAIEIYWHIASCEEKGYSIEILDPSKNHLKELLKGAGEVVKEQYTLACVEIIGTENNDKSSCNAFTILFDIIETHTKFDS